MKKWKDDILELINNINVCAKPDTKKRKINRILKRKILNQTQNQILKKKMNQLLDQLLKHIETFLKK